MNLLHIRGSFVEFYGILFVFEKKFIFFCNLATLLCVLKN